MAEAVLQIDISAVQDNWRALHSRSDACVETGAAVKADGYGLGIEQIAAGPSGSGRADILCGAGRRRRNSPQDAG